jgi:hypothetical protein
MAPKEITVVEDETFHPETCLVAIEPVSDFVLVEEYAEDRKAATWTKVVADGLKGLQVKVVQGTSDEAKAIIAHVQDAFDAHHSPDLFHVQRELSRATSLPLAQRVQQAERALEDAMTATEQATSDQGSYESAKHGPGRPPDFVGRITAAGEAEARARQRLDEAIGNRDQARDAIAGISATYHPYALADGAAQSPEKVAAGLQEAIRAIQAIADRAGLSEKSRAGIAKAGRVTGAMVETIRFVERRTKARLEALQLPDEIHQVVARQLVPGLYLRAVARRASTAEEKRRLTLTAETLLAPTCDPRNPLQLLSETQRRDIWSAAQACADLFQRSSSCVEGRNGHLALYHHGLHRLPRRKLEALTVVHNYFSRRPDGTTAAERFFGTPHEDLFEHLLARMPSLGRPRGGRLARGGRRPVRQGSAAVGA